MHGFDRITVYRLSIPLTVPYRLSFGAVEHFDTLVVELTDGAGGVGLGEATVLTGYTDETIDESWQTALRFAEALVDGDAAAAWDRVTRLGARLPFTASAFGTALEMLGASPLLRVPAETRVPLAGLLHSTAEEEIHAESERLLAEGYRTIKLKVGFDPRKDAALVRTAQRAVRGRARIRVDANQGYSAGQGIAFASTLDPADIELFEQPCAAGDWESHLAVARASPVPLMLDESIYTAADIEKAAALGAAAFIKVKLMKLVTLSSLAAAIARIRELGMGIVLGNGVACDLGCWMEGCVAASLVDTAGEMNGFLKARAPLLKQRLEFRGGALVLKPDFAAELDDSVLRRHLVDSVTRTRAAAGVARAHGGRP